MEDTIEDEGWPYEVTEAAEECGPRHAKPYSQYADIQKSTHANMRAKLAATLNGTVRKGRHA